MMGERETDTFLTLFSDSSTSEPPEVSTNAATASSLQREKHLVNFDVQHKDHNNMCIV